MRNILKSTHRRKVRSKQFSQLEDDLQVDFEPSLAPKSLSNECRHDERTAGNIGCVKAVGSYRESRLAKNVLYQQNNSFCGLSSSAHKK